VWLQILEECQQNRFVTFLIGNESCLFLKSLESGGGAVFRHEVSVKIETMTDTKSVWCHSFRVSMESKVWLRSPKRWNIIHNSSANNFPQIWNPASAQKHIEKFEIWVNISWQCTFPQISIIQPMFGWNEYQKSFASDWRNLAPSEFFLVFFGFLKEKLRDSFSLMRKTSFRVFTPFPVKYQNQSWYRSLWLESCDFVVDQELKWR
jgi:hypothetical protein